MKTGNNRAMKRIYISGIISGIFVCLIIILLLQLFGVIPRWWRTEFVEDVGNRADVVEHYISKYYWKDDVSTDKMAEYAAKGMVSALGDKYSVYYSQEEYDDAMKSVNGDYNGIGAMIRLDSKTNRKYVGSVEEGKPAAKAGLQAGDEILKVDGISVADKTLAEIVSLIGGEEGKTVIITISRTKDGESVQEEISVTSERIINQSVYSRMLEGKTGYIRISQFDRETVGQYKTAVDTLEKQGQIKLIIDVRNNGGGSLEACIDMLDRMLPAGKLITETSKSRGNKEYSSTDEEHFDKPVAILINGNSASASEVFAGTMQGRAAAVLVGEKSFGKGIVQTIFSLKDVCGGGIKLTTGEYLLPGGRSIHEVGLTPDVEVGYTGTSKELGGEDDNQLKKAQEVLNGQS